MSTPELAPRRAIGGIAAVWIVAAVAGVVVGIFTTGYMRPGWLTVAMGGCFILSFAIQLAYGRSHNFILRVSASVLGALVILGVISAGFALAQAIPG